MLIGKKFISDSLTTSFDIDYEGDITLGVRPDKIQIVNDTDTNNGSAKDYSSGLDLFKNKNNVFILRTFSKVFGLASLRVGWGHGSKKIVDALNVIKPPFNGS
jgi:histidinol-phosphate aminotransferase